MHQNHLQVLTKCLVLLYRNNEMTTRDSSIFDLINAVLETIQSSNTIYTGMETSNDITNQLKALVGKFVDDFSSNKDIDKNDYLSQIKITCDTNTVIYDAIKLALDEDMANADEKVEKRLKKTILQAKEFIQNHIKIVGISKIISSAHSKFLTGLNGIRNVDEYVRREVSDKLEAILNANANTDLGIIKEVKSDDESSIKKMAKLIKLVVGSDGVMTTGLHELDRYLSGGTRRGEFLAVNALKHNYKSSFLLTLFANTAYYNTPTLIDSKKIPLMVYITFEDPTEENIKFLYTYLKYNETKEFVNIDDVDTDQMTDYVISTLGKNGMATRFLQIDPFKWSYNSFFNYIIRLEAEGYEIIAVATDYLNHLPKTGCITGGVPGENIRDLFRRVRNFCNIRKILMMTPHQLNTRSKDLLRQPTFDPRDFLSFVKGKGYFDGCGTIDQEFDIELYVHIVNMTYNVANKKIKKSFLNVAGAKHRNHHPEPKSDNFYYPFLLPKMPILPDIKDIQPRHIYSIPSTLNHGDDNDDDLFFGAI